MAAYPAAIALAVVSPIIIALILPPLYWHIKARNIGTCSVILWTIVLNLFTFVNAIIWPNDDFDGRYDGFGLCDIEIKFQVAGQIALPASFACILRALATVLDTDNMTVTPLHKKRNMIIDLLWCVGFPLLQMPLHYIVQPTRYFLVGISGCTLSVSNDWVMVVIILLPPMIWTIISAYYAVFVIIRLWKYRKSIKSILQHSGTDRSRFLRLYAICIVWILGSIPAQCYVFWLTFLNLTPYSWSDVHDPVQWKIIYKLPSFGAVVRDRYIWLATAIMLFLFFALGRDSVKMYSSVFARLGCTRSWLPRQKTNNHICTQNESKLVGVSQSAATESTGRSSIDLEIVRHPVEHV